MRRKNRRVFRPPSVPDDLRVLLSLLNTKNVRTGTDELTEPRALGAWLARHALLPVEADLTAVDLKRFLDVRQGVRALLLAEHGADLDRDAVRALDQVAAQGHVRMRFHDDGSIRFGAGSVDEALGHLVGLVFLTRREGLWKRFKFCADSECRAGFYDVSTNATSKWCTRRCGNRMRARAYRRTEKYKAKPRDAPPRLPRLFRNYMID